MVEEVNITPRNNNFLLGQTKAEEIFLKAWKKQTMHLPFIPTAPPKGPEDIETPLMGKVISLLICLLNLLQCM